jgi:AcrR family transcriptional regulator
VQPRTRKPASVRREETARAVLRIVGERGYPALTTATLAEEVGVTTGALFRHFASLEEILRETAAHAIGRIEETFPDPSLPPMTRILQLAKNRMRVLGPDPGLSWLLRSDQAPALPADAVEHSARSSCAPGSSSSTRFGKGLGQGIRATSSPILVVDPDDPP